MVGWVICRTTERQTDCCFNFKRADVVDDEVHMCGQCIECESLVAAKACNNIEKLTVSISGISKGAKAHTFQNCRGMVEIEKQEYAKKLISDYAFNVRNEKLTEYMAAEGLKPFEPRNIPTTNALKLLKSREQKCTANLTIQSLVKMKFEEKEYRDVIYLLIVPFQLMFWTPYQQFYFTQIKKSERICISIDATDSLVNAKSILSGFDLQSNVQLPHIFLYLIVLKRKNGKSVPVGQFLSQDQHFIEIKYYLERWVSDFGVPDEVNTDESPALIKALVLAFISCRNVDDYLSRSYAVLNGNIDALPETFIRLDVAHFVKTLHRCKVFKKSQEIKYFYLCIMGYCMQENLLC